MNSLAKIKRDRTIADLAGVEELLASLKPNDMITRISLEDRRDELRRSIDELSEAVSDGLASVALFFGGRPVVSNRGIEAEFAGDIAQKFQDLIAKYLAQTDRSLGERGVVPNKNASTLHISNVVRGSFGFVFEEIQDQTQFLDTDLKYAVEQVTDLLEAYSDESDQGFASKLEMIDQRVLSATAQFFEAIQKNGATFRVVANEQDAQFGRRAIERAVTRAQAADIFIEEDEISGIFLGALPESHRFELKESESEDIVFGTIDKSMPPNQIAKLNSDMANHRVRAKISRKRILREGSTIRETITLIDLQRDG